MYFEVDFGTLQNNLRKDIHVRRKSLYLETFTVYLLNVPILYPLKKGFLVFSGGIKWEN